MTIQVLTEKQLPQRAIARQLGVTEGTVRYHLQRQRAGATDGRHERWFRAEAVAEAIATWLGGRPQPERPANVHELHEHLQEAHGYEGSYRSVLRYVRHRYGRPPLRTYRRVETPPGAQTQTDWGEYPDVDLGEGPEWLHAFVMALSYSRKPAIVWSRQEDQVSWLHCHNEAYLRLGGVAAVNRIDNVKTAISAGAGAWGVIHPVYRSYARSLGFHVDACSPGEPQAKGKSEAKVRLSRSLVDPRGRGYGGLGELQAVTDEKVAHWCERTVCPATGRSVLETWMEECRLLRPLPELLPKPFDVVVTRPVHRDCMVHFEGRQYAVPFAYAGRTVEVRGCAGTVQIVHQDRLLREYARRTPQRLLVDPSCYEGPATARALPPPPLGRMGRRLQEIYALPVERRPLDLYAALAEVAR